MYVVLPRQGDAAPRSSTQTSVQYSEAWFFVIILAVEHLPGREDMEMKPYALQNEAADLDLDVWSGPAGRGGREPADFCSRDGAMALKEKIEAYWRERGQHVMIALHNVGFHPAIRAARYDVRSDMVNGMPRAKAKKPALHVVEEAFVEDFNLQDEDLAFE